MSHETYSKEEWKVIDSEFSRLSAQGITYLDHAGAALYSEQQIRDSYARLRENLYCNPHTNELTGREVDEVRDKVLAFFNTSASDYSVVFTRGATEGLKMVAETFDFQTTGHFMYLRNCHNSVLGMRSLVKTRNVHVMEVDGFLSLPNAAEHETSSVYSISNSLMVYPAQCNFNGFKYPLEVIDKFQNAARLPVELQSMSKNWYVCLDAANYVSTSSLDLSKYRPDFVAFSFYKIFGYPTGLGALLVSRRRGEQVLKKVFHGGGTVDFALSGVELHRKKSLFHERFEDGTLPFLSIVSLLSGFETIKRLIPEAVAAADGKQSMERVSSHVFWLAKYVYDQLKGLRYSNGQELITFYNQTEFRPEDKPLQGGIVTFNVHRFNGEFAGYKEIEGLAQMNDIYLRVGCFCNPGACQLNLNLSTKDVMQLTSSNGGCNGPWDVIEDQPLGFVRISVGYVTSKSNVDVFLRVIKEYFLGLLSIPKRVENEWQLLQIRVYPLRDAAPLICSTKWVVNKNQLQFEDHWTVVNELGINLTTKTCPKMSLIRVLINERKKTMRLIFPQRSHLDIPLQQGFDRIGIKRLGFENQKNITDAGDEAAMWLRDVLGMENIRLIKREPLEGKKTIVPVDSYRTKQEVELMRVLNLTALLDYLKGFGIQSTDPVVEEFIQMFRPHLILYGDREFNEGESFKLEDQCFKVKWIFTYELFWINVPFLSDPGTLFKDAAASVQLVDRREGLAICSEDLERARSAI